MNDRAADCAPRPEPLSDNPLSGHDGAVASDDGSGVRVVAVEFGAAARRAIADFVAGAKADDPLAPVTVIVPSNYTGLALRRAIGAGSLTGATRRSGGIAALETLTLAGLADRLAGTSLQAAGRRPLNVLMLTSAMRAALREQPGLFAPVARHRRTAQALAGAYQELRGLNAEQLERVAAGSPRAREVVAICQRVRRAVRRDWYDEVDLLTEAVHVARARATQATSTGSAGAAADSPSCSRTSEPDATASSLSAFGAVAAYLPRRLSGNEGALIRALGPLSLSGQVTVLLGVTGDRHADAGAVASCDRLRVETPAALRRPMPPRAQREPACRAPDGTPVEPDSMTACTTADHPDETSPVGTAIVSVTDPDEEARTAVRLIMSDLDDGVPPASLAVFYGPNEPYGRTLEEQFEAAGIATYGSTARTLAESAYGRFAVGLAALADTDHDEPRLGRRDVFELIAGAKVPLRPDRRRAGENMFVPDSKWERLARLARVTDGDWRTRLELHAHEQLGRAAAERESPEPNSAAVARCEAEASECGLIIEFVEELRDRINDGRSRTTWGRLSAWMRSSLRRYLGQVGRDNWTDRWPHWERTAAERVEDVLSRLEGLSQFEPRVDLAVMADVLTDELAQPHGRSGREGDGIYVGPVAGAVDVAPVRAYILGMSEGILPGRSQPGTLISTEARQDLGGALTRDVDDVADQHRMVLAAIAGARERCTLLVPRGNLRQSAQYVPSRWLTPTARALTAHDAKSDVGQGYIDAARLAAAAADPAVAAVTEVPSYLSGVRDASFPATENEYDSADVLLTRARRGAVARHRLFDVPAFRNGVEMDRARRGTSFTRFDGNLAGVIDSRGALADVISPTRLEHWAVCPRRYLFEHLLGVRALEEPEEIVRLSPLERGNLMHDAIDRFLSPLIENRTLSPPGSVGAAEGPDRPPPGPSRPPTDEDRDELVALGASLADELAARGLTGHELLWERDRTMLLADLRVLLDREGELRDCPANKAGPELPRGEVIGSEFRFGRTAEAPAVHYRMGNGERVQFRGSIDRVELTADGGLVVIDYKSGQSKTSFARTQPSRNRPADLTARGRLLQLPVYALAAAQHFAADGTPPTLHAAYWFCTSGAGNWDWLTMAVDAPLMERFDEVVTLIVTGIRSGTFPGYAEADGDNRDFVSCRYCDPDGIGTADVVRDWKRKRNDAALAGVVSLFEPENAGESVR